jgi:hypothetical protein
MFGVNVVETVSLDLLDMLQLVDSQALYYISPEAGSIENGGVKHGYKEHAR